MKLSILILVIRFKPFAKTGLASWQQSLVMMKGVLTFTLGQQDTPNM